MTVADDVLAILTGQPAAMTDAELARRLDKRHQHINQVCRLLSERGLLLRERRSGAIVNRLASHTTTGTVGQAMATPAPLSRRAPDGGTDGTVPARRLREARESGWEGEVQAAVVRHLSTIGWAIVRVADTATRERGVDVIAERDGRRLLVEVKGWPTTTYARGDRAGQPKPTQPSTQAGAWFAQGLLKLIRCHGVEPDAGLALALPDRPRYRTLLDDSRWAFERLGITVFLVDPHGTVTTWN